MAKEKVMLIEKFIRMECSACGASCSIVEGSMDETKYEVEFCPYCAESTCVEFYQEEAEAE